MIYFFTKKVNSAVLQEMIMLDAVLYPLITSVVVKLNADGTYPDNNIEIHTNDVLNSTNEALLTDMIANYSPLSPLAYRKSLEDSLIAPCVTFGNEFLTKFGTNNVYLQKSDEAIDYLIDTYPDIVLCAMTGSLKSLYRRLCTITANQYISQSEINEFKRRLEVKLGLV